MSRPRSVLTTSVAVLVAASLAGISSASSGASVATSSFSIASSAVGDDAAAERRSAARQVARLLMHPQMAQPGTGTAAASKAQSVISAEFKPVVKGRMVVLQRKKGSGWAKVATQRENGRGIAEFTAPYQMDGKVQTYRAYAVRTSRYGQATTTPVAASKWGAPDFSDEFSGPVLGPAWTHRLQGYQPESRRKCSKADPQAVEVGGGVVRLAVIDDPARGANNPDDVLNNTEKCHYDGAGGGEAGDYDWRLNGHIGTQSTQTFKYGYAAARVKFQPRRGQHASFWLQPAAPEASEGSAQQTGAEIDIIEWFGKGHPSGGLTSFIYHYPDDGKPGITPKKVGGFIKNAGRFGSDWEKKYHVFSVEWTPQRYVFRIDGKETFRTSQGVSGQAQFLILSILSSDYELGFLGGEGNLPQKMSVDWVRYWQR